MEKEKYFAYDKIEIPDDIKNMSDKELDKEIARLEAEASERRRLTQRERKAG